MVTTGDPQYDGCAPFMANIMPATTQPTYVFPKETY